MANFCEVCGKGTMTGHRITHSDKKIKRKWKPNVKKVTVVENGVSKRKTVCTRCIRAGKIQRAM
ncbi:MAG TPA: 50S ribosomal protein L28 [Tissierellia bacterium]|nr:50S ribosomal protein L28 [Tissierellia bacterium]